MRVISSVYTPNTFAFANVSSGFYAHYIPFSNEEINVRNAFYIINKIMASVNGF